MESESVLPLSNYLITTNYTTTPLDFRDPVCYSVSCPWLAPRELLYPHNTRSAITSSN